ncbi:MAG: 2-oxoglutarate dehydrogenase E1 component [Desulfobacteraceae bacterium]|nr:2-oxoglutarate dehydrogenase E1 component [Desulfobacteraceae bacterium]
MSISESLNVDLIDSQYRRWKADPDSVSEDWRYFFEGFDIGLGRGTGTEEGVDDESAARQVRVEALKHRYRDIGHLLSCMDPLESCPTEHPLLELSAFGLEPEDLNRSFPTGDLQVGTETAELKEIVRHLKETYCRSVGVEYLHLQDPEERRWLQERMEANRNRAELNAEQRRRILYKLQQSAIFEQFLNKKYVAVTRFSLEGGDALIPMLDAVADHATANGCGEIVLGMAHRGRLNVQTHILERPYEHIFSEFEHCYDPDSLVGAGDVKYHNGYLADVETAGGRPLRMYLVNNPSHLEAVGPVVEGIARARQDLLGEDRRQKVLPLLLHGDAAFAGQGVVFETLNLSQLSGYRTGGTVHVVINNQIGYTTLPDDARSTRYATDVAKMLMVPVFHVHGEDPEAAVHVARLAVEYRMAFGKDVVIDLVCYRRYGHNEGDEPYFTQPQMYERIRQRPSLHRMYTDRLVEEGVVDGQEAQQTEKAIGGRIEEAYDEIHDSACAFPEANFYESWEKIGGTYDHRPLETGVDRDRLVRLGRCLNTVPESFHLYQKLKGLLEKRASAVEKGEALDWGNAESLCFASLLTEKIPIRLSGQDSARGTFSQRHSVLVDTETGETYTPLNHLEEDQALYEVRNSPLSEYAVLGFEYGVSLVRPEMLTLWEAQFGDFVNNAQAILDLFIASGQSKWQRLSGLTLLLPHGYEGLGPEHSSARPERFLQLCAEDNIQVCYPSTPAQYYHLLRRQVLRDFRKPLVVLTPKSLLRNPKAVSSLEDLGSGRFGEVLPDGQAPENPKRVLLCSGKIFYELLQRREEVEEKETAIVRVEQFYPFPETQLEETLSTFSKVKEWAWVQEEPENMGAWRFMRPRLEDLLQSRLSYVGRPAAASPATGFPVKYKQQQKSILETALP